ncbi:MAG: AMP-binding protein [Tidjanibacter sp.]|nr:AMP-binding protein [Tidjanibacter sp.]
MTSHNIIQLYENNFKKCSDEIALTDYFTKKNYSYGEMATEIERLHIFMADCGVKKGNKVALIGKNNTQFVITYIAVVTYGAVIVPILSDFNPNDAVNIINHSDSVLLFADQKIWESFADAEFEQLQGAIELDTRVLLKDFTADNKITAALEGMDAKFAERHPNGFDSSKIKYADVDMDDVMIISYTSGTTGLSKGVMLTVGNITGNVQFALGKKFHVYRSRVLALLPLAHAYGCAFDMLTPLAIGSHITLLGRTPSPKILIQAMKEVKPHLICTVPLVMEKIVRNQVMPKLQKQPLKTLVKIPLLNKVIYNKVKKTMVEAFGGCITEVNMGGAALNPDVEKFLLKIKFPATVGYGMTECGPLISYERWQRYKPASCGKILPGMEVKIVPTDGSNGKTGEVCVRGMNVMKGYYKNPKATEEAIDSEGWLHTGDIGFADPDGTISLRGRCKSMILSSNGQNIYPEEIEAKLNVLECVLESLVLEDKGRLVAYVVPDYDMAKNNGWDIDAIKEIMKNNLNILNSLVAPYEQVSDVKICEEEFVKTPKRSIRRYLYPANAKVIA